MGNLQGTWLIIGLARSGCAAGALLRRCGARVVGGDDAERTALEAKWEHGGLMDAAASAYHEIRTGADWWLDLPALDGVVLSPGVPGDHPALKSLPSGTTIIGELELGWRVFAGEALAVTGTNGKTTTTELVAHLLREAGYDAYALGNLGRPLSDVADALGPDAVAVIEASSFQLETIDTFRPRAGAVLNLAPDHLDRYPDLDAYFEAKHNLIKALGDEGLFVTWTDCIEALSWSAARRTLFGARRDGASVFLQDGWLVRLRGGDEEPILPIADLGLKGGPNLLNAMAAVALVEVYDVDAQVLATGLRSFRGLPHRQELVIESAGVRFVDDSKATNVHAVCAGLAGYDADVVVILCGSGKGENYAPLRDAMGSVSHAVLIGAEADAMAEALAGAVAIVRASSMDEAVHTAAALADGRGTVLLSPACASFDMFRDYHHRGEAFAGAARAWAATREGTRP